MRAAGFFKIAKPKGNKIVLDAARHNLREIKVERDGVGPIDAGRSHLNVVLRGPTQARAVAALSADLLRAAGIDRPPRKDSVMLIEALFSVPSYSTVDLKSYFEACTSWMEHHFGGGANVLSSVIHLDEAAPHCHVLVLPLVNGRLRGSQLVGGRKRLAELSDDFFESVCENFGLARPPKRLSKRDSAMLSKMVLATIKDRDDPMLSSPLWQLIRDSIEERPWGFAQALGVDVRPAAKRSRTMTDIFISCGKGPRTEKAARAADAANGDRLLCSVGFDDRDPASAEAPVNCAPGVEGQAGPEGGVAPAALGEVRQQADRGDALNDGQFRKMSGGAE